MKSFVLALMLCIEVSVEGAKLKPVNFEFSHEEHLVIGEDDSESDQEHYDIEGIGVDDGGHIRRKRNAQWAPDYDLYGQWAEEYYASYEAPEEEAKAVEAPKKDILDKILDIHENKTKEETDQERAERAKRKKSLRIQFKLITWMIGIFIVFMFFWRFITKILAALGLDFCDSMKFKDKVQKLVNAFVPGVYIHPDGRKEFYIPTEEELDAVQEVKQLLMSMRMQ